MKKILVLLLLAAGIQNIYSGPVRLIKSGEYAAYHDTRGGSDFFRAYWGHNIDEGGLLFCIRNIDNNTGKHINYMAQLSCSDDGTFSFEKINGMREDDPKEFRQSLVDLLNFLQVYSLHDHEAGEHRVHKSSAEYTEEYYFDSHLPLFGFNKIELQGHSTGYQIEYAGSLSFDDMQPFFELQPIDKYNINNRRGLGVPESELLRADLGDFVIDLDSNWKSNNDMGFPGYWLSIYSYRDSQIMLEKQNWSEFKSIGIESLDEFIRRTLYLPGDKIIMDALEMDITDGEYTVSYFLIDSNNNYNYIEKRLWLEEGYLYIFNFSTFSDIYHQNTEYYDRIIESFRRK